jgi:hypothetical protein
MASFALTDGHNGHTERFVSWRTAQRRKTNLMQHTVAAIVFAATRPTFIGRQHPKTNWIELHMAQATEASGSGWLRFLKNKCCKYARFSIRAVGTPLLDETLVYRAMRFER